MHQTDYTCNINTPRNNYDFERITVVVEITLRIAIANHDEHLGFNNLRYKLCHDIYQNHVEHF